ncbi:Rha family transcriptional regulator [Acinetobacter vivianii]|uniref:Rha family transcriptional regulator n=1 Tax=Acinetobacter vivianii TaxID=1776742 RepID=UPI003CFD1568
MTSLTMNFNTQTATAISLPSSATVQTMSTREIAELTGKEHRHVKRDTEVMLCQLNLPVKGYAQIWTHPQNGQDYEEYLLDKELTTCLVSGYNVQLRLAIIKRWTELEQQALMMNRPSYMIEDPVARAKKWIEEETLKQETQLKLVEATKVIEVQAPKAEVFDAVLDKSRTYSIREFAQRTGVKEKDVKKWLADKLWMTGTDSKSYRPLARANVGNYMRMVKQGKTFTDKWGIPHHNEIIEFTQDGFNEAVRKMVKSGMMKPLTNA